MQTLIEAALAFSPRASWQREHGLVLREYKHVHSLNKGGDRWVCCNRAMTRYASGPTEDAAEQAYCERYSIQWWKLAQWNEVMDPTFHVAVVPGDGINISIEVVDEEMALG